MEPSLTEIAKSSDEMRVVAAHRTGEVLGSRTVLKSDHSPACQIRSLRHRVEGAPNFREVPGCPVYGVANPTIDGIRSVIEMIWSLRGGRPVFWHNMREEAAIYINGTPFVVLRELERPLSTGIDVEEMEARLKEDILREAKRYEGAIMVIHEAKDGQSFHLWEHIDADSVQTPLEVYKFLEADGYPVKYARVPIADGKAPKSSDFDTMTSNITSASKDTAFVFSSQRGRGRTTTGTVIACLVNLRINYGRPIKVLYDALNHDVVAEYYSSGGEETVSINTETRPHNSGRRTETGHGSAVGMDDILLLWENTRLLDNGVEYREALDAVIDRCSELQNIGEAVLRYRNVFNKQHVEPRVRSAALKRGAEYLERYFRLIAFAAYLGSETLDAFFVKGESKMTFKNWLHQRPEVQAMKRSIRLRPARFFIIPAQHESQHGDASMELVVNERSGSVLGQGSILEMFFSPGQGTSNRLQINEKGGDSTERIREEAVVYINGTPFVLRELSKPFDTLKHSGITGAEVESIETRLKEDILSELRELGGRVLLHREEYNLGSNQSRVIGYWENIQPESVKTPAEVHTAPYGRIPLIREGDALASNVDAIQYCKDEISISILPDDIILMIVGFLSAKDAVRVSVLSKGFQKLFTVISDVEANQENWRGVCDRILALPVLVTRIRRFSLKLEQLDEEHYIHVNKCICHVLNLGVMDLELRINGGEGYSLPSEVFTSKTVVKLNMGNGFVIDHLPRNALLPALETLNLHSVRFYSLGDCAFQALLFASPALKELCIHGMNRETWEWSGILSSQSLDRLSIERVFSEDYDGPPDDQITFATPCLRFLNYSDFVPAGYSAVHFDSLVEAKLDLHMVSNPQWDERFPHDRDLHCSNPAKLIKGIRHVKILELSSSFNFEALYFFRRAIPVFNNLHQLTIVHEETSFLLGVSSLFAKEHSSFEETGH